MPGLATAAGQARAWHARCWARSVSKPLSEQNIIRARKAETKAVARPRWLGRLVEVVLLAPLFLVAYLGAVEAGNMLLTWLTLQSAARSGAHAAVSSPAGPDAERMTRIISEASAKAAWLKNGSAVVLVSSWPGLETVGPGREGDPGRPGDTVEVRVVFAYQPLIPLLQGLGGLRKTLGGGEPAAAADGLGHEGPTRLGWGKGFQLTGRGRGVNGAGQAE